VVLTDWRHCRNIVAAFGDVWEAVLSSPQPQSHSHAATVVAAAAASDATSCKAAAMSHPQITCSSHTYVVCALLLIR
jgi:hypothetical protein